jgi:uncharacterized membrane protein YkoI
MVAGARSFWADKSDKAVVAKEVLLRAKIDLPQAIDMAQKKIPDGKPFAFRAEMQEGNPVFGGYFLVGETIKEVEVDSVTGDIQEIKERKGNNERQERKFKAAQEVLKQAKVSLAEALEMAIGKVKDGKAFETEMEFADDKPIVEVELLTGDTITKVQVDAKDAKVVKVLETKRE